MSIVHESEKVPLELTPAGVIRVAGSRVTLDTVLAVFKEGASAEEIVLRFNTLNLADVYSVIAYYLHHRDEVERYLQESRERSAEVRQQVEARQGVQNIRERLLSRRGKLV